MNYKYISSFSIPGLELLAAGMAAVAGLLVLGVRRRHALAHPPLSSGDLVVGPYEIQCLLGQGGYARTYMARHASEGGVVALKVLLPKGAREAAVRARFRQEAEVGRRLDHPGIVRILGLGLDDPTPWMALEYCPGHTLSEILRDGPLPPAEAVRITLALAEALTYAHGEGVIHRDLKPGNVMLVDGHVKLLDLGIARGVEDPSLTPTDAFLGTPHYAAPEAQTQVDVGPAADRYSLGILLFELVVGHPPFLGETPFDILDQHRRRSLPPLPPRIPYPLAELIRALTAKNPGDRPGDGPLVNRLRELRASTQEAGPI